MRFQIEHRNHRSGEVQTSADYVDIESLEQAEKDSFKTLCHEAADGERMHADASIVIRDELGRAMSVVCIHATVKRL